MSSSSKAVPKGAKKAKSPEKGKKGKTVKASLSKGAKGGSVNTTLSEESGMTILIKHLNEGLKVKKCEDILSPRQIFEDYLRTNNGNEEEAFKHFYELGWRGECCV